jgi:membrane-associated phospholipid phosphatase
VWPPIAVTAMALLGWAVGKRSTPVDDWFLRQRHSPARWLLFFTDPWVLAPVLMGVVVVALYQRRWRLAAVAVACPPVAVVLVQLLKRLFDRQKGGGLAYPGGHTTVAVVVFGMVVLAAGAALWAVLIAVASVLLGMIGQAVTYHYFTDTVGALLLGTALVCVAAQIAGLDRCQPRVRSASQRGLA